MYYTYEKASDAILEDFKDAEITACLETEDYYIFAIKPKEMTGKIVDNMYLFDRHTGKACGFVMALHADIYRKAKKINITEKE